MPAPSVPPMTREIAPDDAHSIAPDIAGDGRAQKRGDARPAPAEPDRPPQQSCTGRTARSRHHPRHRRRHHAGDVPLGAGTDHRRAGSAGDRQESWRHRRSVVDRDRLSARRHRGDAAVRQAFRYLRPPRSASGRDRHLRRRFGRLRAGADDLDFDSRARAARHRRRRPVADRADHHRRPAVAARAPGGAGPHLDHVHERQHSRPGARRLAHRPSALVVHFLDQSAARRGGAGDDRARAAPPAAQRPAASSST